MTGILELTGASIVREAAQRQDADPAEFRFLEPLDRLADSLAREARLTPEGSRIVRSSLVATLERQITLDRLIHRHPEITATPVPRPIIITGLLRTGTTLVHNLLAQHPGLRVPALWELLDPATERLGAAEYEAMADRAQDYVDEYNRVAPQLPRIHFLDARRPDECHRLIGTTFASMVYEMRYRVPGYGAWLAGQDLTEQYRYHRRQLQALLWRVPGAPVVLKCPFHLWSLPALIAAYPDARIVHMHRDPAETVPSTASLCAAIREARSDRVDRAEIGPYWLRRIEPIITDVAATRRAVPAGQILDVRYRDLVRDPVGQAGRICDFAGVPMTAVATDAARAYLAGNGAGKHGRHEYHPADFGLDAAGLSRRFTAYRETFGC
ncbi:sulfotransferase [Actinoplanes sp. NPDC049596]|uniref:sulfotransferase family protein n=1 Tax=unclassified Actinoplanes TaxID=2626549 RepID=UPI003435DAEA